MSVCLCLGRKNGSPPLSGTGIPGLLCHHLHPPRNHCLPNPQRQGERVAADKGAASRAADNFCMDALAQVPVLTLLFTPHAKSTTTGDRCQSVGHAGDDTFGSIPVVSHGELSSCCRPEMRNHMPDSGGDPLLRAHSHQLSL